MESLKFRKIIASATLVACGGMALSACADKSIAEDRPAQVVGHYYDDLDEELVYTGKAGGFVEDPEHFYLLVMQCDVPEPRSDAGCDEGALEVTREFFERTNVDQEIVIDNLGDQLIRRVPVKTITKDFKS